MWKLRLKRFSVWPKWLGVGEVVLDTTPLWFKARVFSYRHTFSVTQWVMVLKQFMHCENFPILINVKADLSVHGVIVIVSRRDRIISWFFWNRSNFFRSTYFPFVIFKVKLFIKCGMFPGLPLLGSSRLINLLYNLDSSLRSE